MPVEREGSVDEDLLEDSTARIEDALKAQGYKDAMAPHERTESDSEVVITFRVSRGQQYRVAGVSISGQYDVCRWPNLPIAPRLREGTAVFAGRRSTPRRPLIEDLYQAGGIRRGEGRRRHQDAGARLRLTFRLWSHSTSARGSARWSSSIAVTGNTAIDTATLLEGLRLQKGRPYVVTSLAADRDAILVKYLNEGYENATIDVKPELNRDRTSVNVTYSIREGPQVLVDHVLIAGPQRTDPSTVEKQLRLRAGDPLSRDAVLETQRRLQSLGLYRSVSISELRHGEENRRDLLVSVEEGPGPKHHVGGGFELARRVEQADNSPTAEEVFDAAPRGSFEISWRNLFGTNRSTSVFSSLTLHPQGTAQQNITEYRVVNTLREPKVFDTPIDGLVTLTLEQQFRSSFNFRRKSATAEATRRLAAGFSLIGTYQIQQTNVFDVTADQNLIDRVFPNVRLSSFSLSVAARQRDDQIDPDQRTVLQRVRSAGGESARRRGRLLQVVLPCSRSTSFRTPTASSSPATSFSAWRRGFRSRTRTATPFVDHERTAGARSAAERALLRRRRHDDEGVCDGPARRPAHVPPRSATTRSMRTAFRSAATPRCSTTSSCACRSEGNFETHGFLDTGNVFKRAIDIDFREFRSAVGLGVLYKSPIGPLRFDLGFKVNPLPGESLTAFFITFGTGVLT